MGSVLAIFRSPAGRVVFLVVIGLSLIAVGIGTVWSGELFYENYWGGRAFGPFAIMVGAGLLLIVVTRLRRKLTLPEGSHKQARPARQARRLQKRRRKRKRFGS